ncbi:YecA family protein [Sulfuricurvum sp.]|uniref:YecA family protein n=1 Tax=Sulfuricurvum sp. TaxID=2025608 RepID=UPI003BB803C1
MTQKMQTIIDSYPPHFGVLFTLGRNTLVSNFEKQQPFLELGFNHEDSPLLQKMVLNDDFNTITYKKQYDSFFFAPLHALYVLGQLKEDGIAQTLIDNLNDWEDDDYFGFPFAHYFRHIGSKTIPMLSDAYINEKLNIYSRMRILEAFEEIATSDSSSIPKIETILLNFFATDTLNDDGLNGYSLSALKKLTGAKHIDLIREIFATKEVDIYFDGDLEDYEIEFGLRSQRETYKPRPLDKYFANFDDSALFDEIPSMPAIRTEPKIGRNDPCPCGSGKKYKKCCLE